MTPTVQCLDGRCCSTGWILSSGRMTGFVVVAIVVLFCVANKVYCCHIRVCESGIITSLRCSISDLPILQRLMLFAMLPCPASHSGSGSSTGSSIVFRGPKATGPIHLHTRSDPGDKDRVQPSDLLSLHLAAALAAERRNIQLQQTSTQRT